MDFIAALRDFPRILAEGAVIERLQREFAVPLDPLLLHARLPCEPATDGTRILAALHTSYIDIARQAGLPILCATDTWRASAERLRRAGLEGVDLNGAAVRFLSAIRDAQPDMAPRIAIAGLTGPRGDAYRPEEALGAEEAAAFHAPQVASLARAGVDLLFASTLPALSEAIGIARAFAATGLPYVLSFVIRRDGALLDGTPLTRAAETIDAATAGARPTGYMVNCVHPTILREGAARAGLPERFLGLQANASPKSPEELNNCATLESQEPEEFAEAFAETVAACRLQIAGGCCGTDERHITRLAARLA